MLRKWRLWQVWLAEGVHGRVAGSVVGILASSVALALTAPPVAAGTVEVEKGQTLTSIAEEYGTSVGALAAANGISDPNFIRAGSTLQLPAATSSGSSGGAAVAGGTVTVENGQTLTAIAAETGTSVAALVAENGIPDPNLVDAGSVLQVPQAGSPQTTGASSGASSVASGTELPPQLLAHPSRLALRPLFAQAAATYSVPAGLLEALCWWESGWQTDVVSITGAIGLCQIEPSAATFVNTVLYPGSNLDPTDPSDNIAIGAALLHNLLEATGGDESTALAGYYQGLQSVETQGMFPSTVQYVSGILSYATEFSSS